MHFIPILVLSVHILTFSMEEEITQEKENTQWLTNSGSGVLSSIHSTFHQDKKPLPEDKLRILPQEICKQKTFPALKDLALTAVALTRTVDDEFVVKFANLPREPLQKAFLQHRMVEISERYHLNPTAKYVGNFKMCPNDKYLFGRIADNVERQVFDLSDNRYKLILLGSLAFALRIGT